MAITANSLRDELDAQMSSILGADYDALGAEMKAAIMTAIANAVHIWLVGGTGEAQVHTGASVTFLPGDITGVDAPGGDTHSTLIASGGSVS